MSSAKCDEEDAVLMSFEQMTARKERELVTSLAKKQGKRIDSEDDYNEQASSLLIMNDQEFNKVFNSC